MDQILTAVVSECRHDIPPYSAPSGSVWFKEPDEYDQECNVVWEGNWVLRNAGCEDFGSDLVCKVIENKTLPPVVSKSIASVTHHTFCKWKCPNGHMKDHYCYEKDGGYETYEKKYRKELITKQRKAVESMFSPDYHVCRHKSHMSCTKSPCCDVFWHEGECKFVSDVDGQKGGWAYRFGDQ